MKVSTKATYGILAALDLALHNGTAPVQAKAIARRQGIPARFLEHVLQAMKQDGLVESQRGAQGGYLLGRRPEEVTLAAIVQALDGPLPSGPARGMAGRRHRDHKPHVLLAQVWERVRQAELAVLGSVTVKELVEHHKQLEQQRALMYHI